MPDWFYRTLSRPVLFRMNSVQARRVALGFMGWLARLPLGPALIDLLGHMRPDPRLQCDLLGIACPSPVGLGPWLDPEADASAALARFGFGFLAVGPVTIETHPAFPCVERRDAEQALWFPEPPATLGAADLAIRFRRVAPLAVPLLVRIGHLSERTLTDRLADCRRVVEQLEPFAACFAFTLPEPSHDGAWTVEQWRVWVQTLGSSRPVLLCLPSELEPEECARLLRPALEAGIRGVLVDGSCPDKSGGRLIGPPARDLALRLVQSLRQRFGSGLTIVGAGGIHEPEHALQMREAGANLVEIDSGLVYSGPGLTKRINEALLCTAAVPQETAQLREPVRAPERAWFWTMLMGAGMLLGSLMALAIAATRVVLPYDETFSGLTRAQLDAINPHLLAFMAHDRVSLAGTMISIGTLYLGLSLGGVRRGLHWAYVAVLTSALAGFGSFFLFLGFGYFDPFHAFVTAILFQFLLLALHARLGPPVERTPPNLREDWRWRWSQWGQLLLLVQACGLLGAGAMIVSIGATHVFVPEDLEFMQLTTPEVLASAHPRLIPLIAHDRATMGGMLISAGLAVLLTSLWGFRQGHRWLWWTLLAAGTPAYAAAIGVHFAVGYTNLLHLTPAIGGAVVFLLSLGLSYPFLCRTNNA